MTTTQIVTGLWYWNSPPAIVAAGAVAIYALMFGRRATGVQKLWFSAAIGVFLIAMISPVAVLARSYLFSAHMLQHMLLLLIVPMLVLMAFFGSRERTLTHPSPGVPGEGTKRIVPLCWMCGVGAMWFWHIPVLCDWSLRSDAIFAVQTVSLLLAGTAFWYPILSSHALEPPRAVLYLFSSCVGCTLLGIYITFSPLSVCPIYHHAPDPLGLLPTIRGQWGLSLAADQQIGGLLMWAPGCAVYLSVIMVMMRRWYRAPITEAEVAG